jgi:hypothetical protein
VDIWKQWAAYYTSQNLNFGQRTTSPAEGGNSSIKGFLLNGRGSFFTVYQALTQLTDHQAKLYDEKQASERVKIPMRYLGQEYLGELPRAISFHALTLLEKEHAIALKAIPATSRPHATIRALGNCEAEKCTMRQHFGLPCRHEIARKMLAKEPLELEDVHKRWRLSTRLEDELPYANLKNPLPAPQGRGRPKKTTGKRGAASRVLPPARGTSRLQPSVRRYRSQFEMDIQPEVEAAAELLGVTVVRPPTAPRPVEQPAQDAPAPEGQEEQGEQPRRSGRALRPSRAAAEAAETARLGGSKRRRVA